jgi:hypothetical protein
MKLLQPLLLLIIALILSGCHKPDSVADITNLQGSHPMTGSERATNTVATFVPDTTFRLSFNVEIKVIDKNTIKTSANDSFLNANYIQEVLNYLRTDYRTNEMIFTTHFDGFDANWVDTLAYNFVTNQIAQHQISYGNGGRWDVNVHTK